MNLFVLPVSCILFVLLRSIFHHDLIINLWIFVWVVDAFIIGLAVISIFQLIIAIRRKRHPRLGILLAALIVSGSLSYGTDLLKDLGLQLRFYRLKQEYSEIVAMLQSGSISQKGTHHGIPYQSENEPEFRVSFSWGGIIDNWYGVIYDPSGKIMRCNESEPSLLPLQSSSDEKELHQIRMIFGGVLYKAEHLGDHWYLGWFT
jgi:hypothetical protein